MVRSVVFDLGVAYTATNGDRCVTDRYADARRGDHEKHHCLYMERMWNLHDQIRDLHERMAGLEKQIGDFQRQIGEEHDVGRMKNIVRLLRDCEKQLDDLGKQKSPLNAQLGGLDVRLRSLEGERRKILRNGVNRVRDPEEEMADCMTQARCLERRGDDCAVRLQGLGERQREQVVALLEGPGGFYDRNVAQIRELTGIKEVRSGFGKKLRDAEKQKLRRIEKLRDIEKERIVLIRKMRDTGKRVFRHVKQLRNLERQVGGRMERTGDHRGRMVRDYVDRVEGLEKEAFDCADRLLHGAEKIAVHMKRVESLEIRRCRMFRANGFRNPIESLKRWVGHPERSRNETNHRLRQVDILVKENEDVSERLSDIGSRFEDCMREMGHVWRRELRETEESPPWSERVLWETGGAHMWRAKRLSFA
ncbi:MAG: hypothetical protein OXF02_04245 [Simkaniaceae bacterium]|nr:hypothetical protein [Simkaniaceae bacterium]